MQTPLWDALSAHVQKAPVSAHTPGHKSGGLIPETLRAAWGEAVCRDDLTEVAGLDNRKAPSRIRWRPGRRPAAVPMCSTSWVAVRWG